jgi:small-conductance mechanosensitive channel
MDSRAKLLRLSFDKISAEESRKRLLFVLQLVVFIALLYITFHYSLLNYFDGVTNRILRAILFYITTNLVITFSRLTLVYWYIKKNQRQEDFKDNFIIGINKISSILSFLALIISLFVLFNVDIIQFLTSISIVAAAIALLSKDYISNMINGMILMFSDQLSINDDVKIGEHKGKIVNITLINVHMVNEDDDLIFVPNNAVFTADVVNYTKHNGYKVSMEFELQKGQATHLAEMEEYIKQSLKTYTKLIGFSTIELRVVKIGLYSVMFKLQFALLANNKQLEKEIKKYVFEQIIKFISQRPVISNVLEDEE